MDPIGTEKNPLAVFFFPQTVNRWSAIWLQQSDPEKVRSAAAGISLRGSTSKETTNYVPAFWGRIRKIMYCWIYNRWQALNVDPCYGVYSKSWIAVPSWTIGSSLGHTFSTCKVEIFGRDGVQDQKLWESWFCLVQWTSVIQLCIFLGLEDLVNQINATSPLSMHC